MASPVVGTGKSAGLYQERSQRVQDAIALRRSDRIPVIYETQFWHAAYAGYTVREVMYDYKRLTDSYRKAMVDLQPDSMHLNLAHTGIGPLLDGVDYRQLEWPGHGVGNNLPYQYLDREVMKGDEYDLFIQDPTYFCLTRYLPRIAGLFEPFAKFPHLPKMQHIRVLSALSVFAEPDVAQMLAKLVEVGAEAKRMLRRAADFADELATDFGIPVAFAGFSMAPFDYFADYLRGSKGIMLDMYRQKHKLLAAMDRILPMLVDSAVEAASYGRGNVIFIPLHWGLDGFMSEQQFKTFYWPQLRQLMIEMIDRGLVPCPFWEGNCASRLEIISDIPRGKAIYRFERTDLFHAKKVLGDIVCLCGNVPASLLQTGTPDEVRAYCHELIEGIGKTGGLILCGASGIPDDAPAENVLAMFRSVHG
jgi:hypothetical protein